MDPSSHNVLGAIVLFILFLSIYISDNFFVLSFFLFVFCVFKLIGKNPHLMEFISFFFFFIYVVMGYTIDSRFGMISNLWAQ